LKLYLRKGESPEKAHHGCGRGPRRAVGATVALATPAIGTIATLFARGTLVTPVRANADGIMLRRDHSTDHAVQTIRFPPGATSGWHRHPGVVLVTVQTGTLAHYDSSCNRTTTSAGQAFWESGPHQVVVRNETTHDDVVVYVTYIVPTGAPLRIDMPNPGCAVE
jgi:quercetin dioxygenase-like cupin family protein